MMDARYKKSSSALKSSLSEKHYNLARFADYFVICGLDLENGLEAECYTDGVNTLNSPPLERSYKGKSLAHYPENVSWNPFDDYGICMLSLPHGLRFKTQKHDLTARFHSFASTRDDGKRCYGFSLVFYEEVKNDNICTAMQTLQSMYITELSSAQGSLRRSESRSLPRHFRLAEEDPSSASSFYDITKDTLYVTKSITLVCQFPYAHVSEIFLTNLYKCLPRQPGARLSLESYVYNMLYDIKVPDNGKSIRIYLPPEQPNSTPINIILQRPKSTELPLLDFPLRVLFNLGVELVVELFTSVLLENQVLLISEDFNKLTIVAECITALLFPFEWSHVFAPVLPTALSHYLLAPVPFIMGLHSENVDATTNKAGLCYLNIDNKTIQIPEEQPSFPHKHEFIADIYEILEKYNLVDKKPPPPPQQPHSDMDSTILNPKNLLNMNNNFYFPSPSSNDKFNGIQYQRLSTSPATTLTLTKSRRKKHSLHEFDEFDSIGSTSHHHHHDSNHHTSSSRSTSKREVEALRTNEQYYNDLQLNAELREIFLNRFCQIFIDYEQFVILPNQSQEEWLKNRESLHNFDKASFLSDQPSHYRLFFSQFLESQMFATLIDNKIMTSFGEKSTSANASDSKPSKSTTDDAHLHCNKNLQLFDNRIKILKKHFGSAEEINVRSKNLENIPHLNSSKVSLEKRLKNFDLEVSPPTEILRSTAAYFRSFPILEASVLNHASSER